MINLLHRFHCSFARQAFDDSGDRINAEYDVINIVKKGGTKVVGSFFYDNVSESSFSSLGKLN